MGGLLTRESLWSALVASSYGWDTAFHFADDRQGWPLQSWLSRVVFAVADEEVIYLTSLYERGKGGRLLIFTPTAVVEAFFDRTSPTGQAGVGDSSVVRRRLEIESASIERAEEKDAGDPASTGWVTVTLRFVDKRVETVPLDPQTDQADAPAQVKRLLGLSTSLRAE